MLSLNICINFKKIPTFKGDSVGANSLELLLHFSINVNRPVFPVAADKNLTN